MSEDLEIRPRRREDNARLGDLFAACFGTVLGPEYFDWKYDLNPAGEAIGFVADAGDRLAASYGVIPEPWRVGAEDTTVYQSMDSMTHPDFQRRGLFVRLANETYDEVRRRTGDCVLVGIPGPNSYPALTGKLAWTEAHRFEPLVVPAAVAGRRWSRRRGDLHVEAVTQPDERLASVLARSPEPRGDAWPLLTGRFFDWRVFGRSPKQLRAALVSLDGAPVAAAVYGLTGPRTTLVSYVACIDGADDSDWLGPLIRFIAKDRGGVLFTWAPTDEASLARYRRAGFRRNRLQRGPLSLRWPFCVRNDSGVVNGVPWGTSTRFDLQPLTHD